MFHRLKRIFVFREGEPPQADSIQSEVETALDAFMSTADWPSGFRLLEERSGILLTATGVDSVRRRLAQQRRQGNQHECEILEETLTYFLLAMDEGIDAARLAWVEKSLVDNAQMKMLFSLLQQMMGVEEIQAIKLKLSTYNGTQDITDFLLAIMRPYTPHATQEDARFALATDISSEELFVMEESLKEYIILLRQREDAGEHMRGVIAQRLALIEEQMLQKIHHPLARAQFHLEVASSLHASTVGNSYERNAQAIEHIKEALSVIPVEQYPGMWSGLQERLGGLFVTQALDSEGNDIHWVDAIQHYQQAMTIVTRDATPERWARLQEEIGTVLIKISPLKNRDVSINCLKNALDVFTQKAHPFRWALTNYNLASIYLGSMDNISLADLEEAIKCCNNALQIIDKRVAGIFHDIHDIRAHCYTLLGQWQLAHSSLLEMRRIQHDLFERLLRDNSRLKTIRDYAENDLYVRDAMVLLQQTPIELQVIYDAVVALEEGKAQYLRMSLHLDELALKALPPEVMERLRNARDIWHQLEQDVDQPLSTSFTEINNHWVDQQFVLYERLQESARSFYELRDEIRLIPDQDAFYSPSSTFKDILAAITEPNEAIVYITVGDKLLPGVALVIVPSTPFAHVIELPRLRLHAITKLLYAVDTPGVLDDPGFARLHGGYLLAQTSSTDFLISLWGRTLAEVRETLPISTHLSQAIEQTLQQHPTWIERCTTPLELLWQSDPSKPDESTALQELISAINAALLSLELHHALSTLQQLAFDDLAQQLLDLKVKKVTFIPYGHLGLFPLSAIPVTLTDKESYLGEAFQVAVAPNAYALSLAKKRVLEAATQRKPYILAIGNPQQIDPTSDLPYAEAEIQTLSAMVERWNHSLSPTKSQALGLTNVVVLSNENATKSNIIPYLGKSWLGWWATHGRIDRINPLRSSLFLANSGEQDNVITIEDCLQGKISVNGMRLLVLSSCEQAVYDPGHLREEMLGMPSGFLQAGVAGVVAPLWAVNDKATYLLMARFASIFLDPQHQYSPTQALTRAQAWLRQLTNAQLSRLYDFSSEIEEEGGVSLPQDDLHPILAEIRQQANGPLADPLICPYADPCYWAAFIVTGC